jgi:glycosyltransferase involved in cell wall biosynthesis
LVANGAEVAILREGDADGRRTDPGGFSVHSFANPSIDRPFSLAPSLKRHLSRAAPDTLTILNGIFHPSVHVAAAVLARARRPYVVSPFDPYNNAIFRKSFWLKYPYWYLCEAPMLRRASAVQVLDRRHGAYLQGVVSRPVFEVQIGFEEVSQPAPCVPRSAGPPRFVALGRLDVYNKGLDLLVDGFSRAFRDETVDLVLKGPDQDAGASRIKDLATKLGLADRVAIEPPDFGASASEIIARHDAFCVASRYEGYCLAAQEAMLAGRVVLISEIAGIAPHIARAGCGVVVKPDPSSIAAGFRALWARREEWPAMGQRGRAYALRHFRWTDIAARALDQYHKVMLA